MPVNGRRRARQARAVQRAVVKVRGNLISVHVLALMRQVLEATLGGCVSPGGQPPCLLHLLIHSTASASSIDTPTLTLLPTTPGK